VSATNKDVASIGILIEPTGAPEPAGPPSNDIPSN